MSDLEWVEPPLARRARVDYAGIVAALKNRPGEWAIVLHSIPANVAAARAQHLRIRYGLEAMSRTDRSGDATSHVYARYVNGKADK